MPGNVMLGHVRTGNARLCLVSAGQVK